MTNNIIDFLLIEYNSAIYVIRISLIQLLLRVECVGVEDFNTGVNESSSTSKENIS